MANVDSIDSPASNMYFERLIHEIENAVNNFNRRIMFSELEGLPRCPELDINLNIKMNLNQYQSLVRDAEITFKSAEYWRPEYEHDPFRSYWSNTYPEYPEVNLKKIPSETVRLRMKKVLPDELFRV